MADAPTQPPAPDLHCITCDYDLTGLPATGPCPECATPISNSLHGPLLRFATPGTWRAVLRATTLLGVALRCVVGALIGYIALFIVVSITVGFILPRLGYRSIGRGLDHLDPIEIGLGAAFAAVIVGFFLAACVYVVGVFFTASPGVLGPVRPRSRATLARYSLIGALVAVPLAIAFQSEPMVAHALGVLASAFLLAHYVAIRTTIGALARRCAPAPKIRPAGAGAVVAGLLLLLTEAGRGWASPFPPIIATFLYLGLEEPVRDICKAVRAELAHDPVPPDAP